MKVLIQQGTSDFFRGENAQLVDRNAQLHSAVIELSGNVVLADLAASMEGKVRWYFSAIALRRAPASWEEHTGLVEAISNGDSLEARRRMADHCESSRIGLLAG